MQLIIKTLLVTVLLMTMAHSAAGQSFRIFGTVLEPDGEQPLPGANVILFTQSDTTQVRGTSTDLAGEFAFQNIRRGAYLIRVSFVGYRSETRQLNIGEEDVGDLQFVLSEDATELDEVHIEAMAQRMEIRGDTTVFNAGAYTTQPDAVAEDLIRRMPGFEVQDGEIRAQGEDITRILIDGEEFFGDDPQIALRNLPASMISQVQVFDRQSDQSRFTGFDDGESERTINFVTHGGLRQGRFGRLSGSLGTTERYMGGGNANFFNGQQRISVIGLSNNMNQQNFSSEDLSGVVEAGRSGRGGRGGGGGGGRGGGGGSSNMADNFRIGQQSGISNVHSFGLNYVDRWDDRWRVNGNYFFNASDNTDIKILERQYHEGVLEDQLYDEQSWSNHNQYNHRMNARVEYAIDDRRSVLFTPNANVTFHDSNRSFEGMTFSNTHDPDSPATLLNRTNNAYELDQMNYNVGNSLLYRHRFDKEGRTFSVNMRTATSRRDGDQLQIGESYYYDDDAEQVYRDNQNSEINTGSRSASADVQFTEPLGDRTQLNMGYRPEWRSNYSDRDAYLYDEESELYDQLDPRISSRFDQTTVAHRISSGLRHRGENYHASATMSFEHSQLNGEQTLPVPVNTQKTYRNLLPRVFAQYRISPQHSLHLSYNTRARSPSASQLQDVIDNTDPLRLTGGNPDLAQEYTHSWSVRYRSTYPESGRSLSGFASMNLTTDNIGNVTFTAPGDTTLRDGIRMGRGARLISPDNTGNALNVRTSISYGMPLRVISSNLNVSSGVMYRQTPVIVNDLRNDSKNTTINGRMSVSSNISREIDFMASYQAAYTFVDNNLQPELDRDYYSGRVRGTMNIMPWRGLVLATDVNIRHFSGDRDAVRNDVYYWNGAIGYRFLENKMAEARLTVVDILGQNRNVDRVFSDTYVEDIRSESLTRYVMLTFSWNFRNFISGQPSDRSRGGDRDGRGGASGRPAR